MAAGADMVGATAADGDMAVAGLIRPIVTGVINSA